VQALTIVNGAPGQTSMTPPDERQIIRDAMHRLLSGSPIRSSGALNVVSLAQEAGVKRYLLTHRHTDLRDEFYDRVRAQGTVPESEVSLRREVTDLKETVAQLRGRTAALTAEIAYLRRMNNVLAVEKAAIEESFRSVRTGQTTGIFGDNNS